MYEIKKLASFFALFTYIMASLGSTAYLFYYDEPLFGILNIGLSCLAFPTAKRLVRFMID